MCVCECVCCVRMCEAEPEDSSTKQGEEGRPAKPHAVKTWPPLEQGKAADRSDQCAAIPSPRPSFLPLQITHPLIPHISI